MSATPATERVCRICHGSLGTVLDLGVLAISDFPTRPPARPAATAPLDLCQCDDCGLVQLRHTVPPERLFRQYWYQSGINETMRGELRHVVEQAMRHVPLVVDDQVVLDIGANDGTLLRAYGEAGFRVYRLAVEPAHNLIPALLPHAEWVSDRFFPDDEHLIRTYAGQVSICTTIACFYDADDPGDFVRAVEHLLAPDGIWILQFQDLHQMLHASAVDNLCHEHLVYYSLGSVARLIEPYGLQIVHAERRAINGGSLRLIVQREAAGPPDATVETLARLEAGCEHWQTLDRFAWQVDQVKQQVTAIIRSAHRQGRTIDLYGASTKANTLLQVCDLGPGLIRQAWERSPEKVGRTTITGIPIVDEATGRADPPDLLLVGIWQFRDGILDRERGYLAGGGTLLFPLPVVESVQVGRAEAAE